MVARNDISRGPVAPQKIHESVTKLSPISSSSPSKVSAEDVYNEAILFIRGILDRVSAKDFSMEAGEVNRVVRGILEEISSAMRRDGILALTREATPKNYLYAHCVNVCILSLEMGEALPLSSEEHALLGEAALLHDLGMPLLLDIISQPRALTTREILEMRKHPLFGVKLLSRMRGMEPARLKMLGEITSQVHERAGGGGYPRGLAGEKIHPLARVIAIADAYEALTQPRFHRAAFPPHKALQIIIQGQESLWDPAGVKIFIEQMGVFPVGSWVKLSSGDVARVVSSNRGSPTRPQVELYKGKGANAPLEKIDLSQTTSIWIEGALDYPEQKLPKQ